MKPSSGAVICRRRRTDKRLVAQEYSSIARTYNVASVATKGRGRRRLRALIRKGDVVLDVGCGPGPALPLILGLTGPRGILLGLDISRDMLLQARGKLSSWARKTKQDKLGTDARSSRVLFILADGEHLPIKRNRVNVALSLLSLHRMDPEVGLKEIWRTISPGGYIFLELPAAHDEDAMVFEHIPPGYLPDHLPRGFPEGFKLDPACWEKEQQSWKRFKEFCGGRIPWLAEAISRGWFQGYDELRARYEEHLAGRIGKRELEEFIRCWEERSRSGRLGWICFPTHREFARILEELGKSGAVLVEANTSSFEKEIMDLLRTRRRYFELYVGMFSQVVRTHSAILWKPPWHEGGT